MVQPKLLQSSSKGEIDKYVNVRCKCCFRFAMGFFCVFFIYFFLFFCSFIISSVNHKICLLLYFFTLTDRFKYTCTIHVLCPLNTKKGPLENWHYLFGGNIRSF